MPLSASERKIREAARLALTESADGIPCVMPGDRIYTVLRKRTPSGTNYFDFYAFHPYPEDGPRARLGAVGRARRRFQGTPPRRTDRVT